MPKAAFNDAFLVDPVPAKAGTSRQERMAFLVDVMLEKLGRWLRILGFRAEDPDDTDDDAILFQAKSRNLILLTMDEELAKRTKKLGIRSLFLPAKMTDITDQIAFVVKKSRISIRNWKSRTLCTKCGGPLDVVSSKSVSDQLPPRVLKRFKDVWRCKSCGHVYWMGSHWKKIGETITKVKSKIRSKVRKSRKAVTRKSK